MPSYVRGGGRRTLTDMEIIQAYVQGETSDSIGMRAGCSGATVLQIVRDAGETIRKPGHQARKTLLIEDADIVRRYKAGETGTALAAAAGCTSRTIYDILRAAGCPIRPPNNVSARRRAFRLPGQADG